MTTRPNVPFLTDIDKRPEVKGSRDPLGILPIWSRLGRYVVGNLTTSVPFDFDVHATIYTEDAPARENTLHRAFNHRRVNRVNEKKEFFKVKMEEIVELVKKHHQDEVDIVMAAEAEEYRKTLAMSEQERAA